MYVFKDDADVIAGIKQELTNDIERATAIMRNDNRPKSLAYNEAKGERNACNRILYILNNYVLEDKPTTDK